MNFLGMGPAELVLVAALALIVFGPDKLPDIARQIGRVVGDLRRVSSDVTREIQRGIQEEPPASGPRIVRQPPSSFPPPETPPQQSPPETTAAETPTILPPTSGPRPTPPPNDRARDEAAAPAPAEPPPDPRRPV